MKFERSLCTGLLLACSLSMSTGCGIDGDAPLTEQEPKKDAQTLAPEPTRLAPLDDHAGHDHTLGIRQIIRDMRTQPGDIPSDTSTHLTFEQPIMQVGLWLDGEAPEEPEFRTRGIDGVWSEWSSAEVTWSEDRFHVARAILAAPALEIEFRAGASH